MINVNITLFLRAAEGEIEVAAYHFGGNTGGGSGGPGGDPDLPPVLAAEGDGGTSDVGGSDKDPPPRRVEKANDIQEKKADM